MNWINGFLGCLYGLTVNIVPLVLVASIFVDTIRRPNGFSDGRDFILALAILLLWLGKWTDKETKQ